ncbi:U4/U6-U5 snRNP complex subunit prp31 [Ascosphaera aggregata]|nr:U4/U6-U5 snRNP complex subunit prp31 [Ascosphaera aggregata]
MATLADELLNDFEDESGSDIERDEEEEGLEHGLKDSGLRETSATAASEGDEDDEMADEEREYAEEGRRLANVKTAEEESTEFEKMQLAGVSDIQNVARLMKKIRPILEKISYYKSLPPEKQSTTVGSIEDNPEYHLLTESNSLSTSIDNEMMLVHKFIRDHYSTRFPELENLVSNPLDYAKTVAILGNGPLDDIKALSSSTDNIVGVSLASVLDRPSLMVVAVEGTTTRGRSLSDEELRIVREGCKMMIDLEKAKATFTSYVQSRMNLFAPNLTILIGSLTAAQLLNFAGGLTGLAKTPSCNIPPLGSKKQSGTGFATNIGVRHQGFLYHSPIIQDIPNDLKKQAMRIVSAKIVLAARVDRMHQSPDGHIGQDLKQQCLDRLDKLTEPPPNKGPKALPVPDDKPSRKRGGRRARKAKEAVAMTDIRKAQNRVAFGKEEAEVGFGTGEGTVGLGMLGQQDSGRVRATQIDQRTKAKLSKSNKGWGAATPLASGTSTSLRTFAHGGVPGSSSVLAAKGLRTAGVGPSLGAGAGIASSISFTPVQGLELVDPKAQAELNRKRKAEEDRWFKSGTFTQLSSRPSMLTNDGFKVPALPAKKVDTGAGKMPPPPPPPSKG